MSRRHHKYPVTFIHAFKRIPFPRAKLSRLVAALYTGEHIKPDGNVTVVFCSDYFIKKLNAAYRKKNRPTDVLSFEFKEPAYLGEIYISLERAAVQARRYQVTLGGELERLLIHGMFHLLGFDHKNTPDRARMEQKEKKYRPREFDNCK
ncbi:MAG: rRNA maturation RNase YbeY [Chitinivibrionales bacterium]|nr:rRNA maturation RNase YbeY [Chitinivibrionales bacterium]